MLRWPVKSALYIDFENVPMAPDAIGGWLAWLEDGCFEPSGRRRRFVQKRVYWNSHAERHRKTFEAQGFSVALVGKHSGLKNGADIRMAMDIVEATYAHSEIDEYILLTGDSDFVPVLERLRAKGKRSVIVATEHRPNIHTTYTQHADLLIPSRQLALAGQYAGSQRIGAWLHSRAGAWAAGYAKKPSGADRGAKPRAGVEEAQRHCAADVGTDSGPFEPALDVALGRILALVRQQPRNFVAQRRILAELARVQGFKRRGDGSFLGFMTYGGLMNELAKRHPCIKVSEQPGGGTGVYYLPPDVLESAPGIEAPSAKPPPPPPVKPVSKAPAKTPPPLPGHREYVADDLPPQQQAVAHCADNGGDKATTLRARLERVEVAGEYQRI